MKKIFLFLMGLISLLILSCEKEDDTNVITDYDGNTYKTVTIGNQTWMSENLKVTHYPNGKAIPLVTDSTAWSNLGDNNTDDAYCYYNNNSNSEYGALYTYAAAKDACPTGWHLPNDEEWLALRDYIMNDGHFETVGTTLKATYGWYNDGNGTNDYGFSALPGGYRNQISSSFRNAGHWGYWWSATEFEDSTACYFFLSDYTTHLDRINFFKSDGHSVRCVKD